MTFWVLPMILTKPVQQLQNTIEHLGLSHEDDILRKYALYAHECGDAVVVLADAVSHGAPCFPELFRFGNCAN